MCSVTPQGRVLSGPLVTSALLFTFPVFWTQQLPSQRGQRRLTLYVEMSPCFSLSGGISHSHLCTPQSGRIDGSHRDHCNAVKLGRRRPPPRVSTNCGSLAQIKGGLPRVARDDELGVVVMATKQRTGIVAGIGVQTVLQPLLLHELELTEQARADCQKMMPWLLLSSSAPGVELPYGIPRRSKRRRLLRTDEPFGSNMSRVLTRRI